MSGEDAVADGAYEVRYGWARRHLIALPGCALVAAFFVWASGQDFSDADGRRGSLLRLLASAPRPVEVGVYLAMAAAAGLLAIDATVVALLGRVALRVDQAGLTVGVPTLLTGWRTARVPWSEIRAVYLWKSSAGHHIGLRRRKGARRLPGTQSRTLARRSAPPGVPIGVADNSRFIGHVPVDHDRLAGAITRFAPHVKVVVMDENGAVAA